ncbi:16S rRNA (cytidine1402-2'-O)-methyltransferase [Saonia flava]|uniref:16S rRNA (Cytidine1402-2'-O)-methyltransferase n=1 Tax=Saonia flava TaxID=523696 RepID=A0A846QNC5_9FLAO|nr:SAM-dependent methyltransferase [Saonia flava]NJB70546.1 16S rRNA (cytidine1402-2'-O)-methyltransferase [Saonia flava]
MPIGKLYLIPTTLGDTPPLEVLPISIKKAIENIDHYIVENEKSARHFIKKINSKKSQPNLQLNSLNKFTDPIDVPSFLDPCLEGYDVGVISEAGCPGIADPGADVVKLAHKKGIQVVPLVGPSSIFLALMASGLNGQNFAFNGYLPIDSTERRKTIKRLEKLSKDFNQSQIFIETPYRNDKLLAELTKTLSKESLICVACDITLPTEFIATKKVSDWQNTNINLHKRPTIFIIHQ